MTDLMWLLVTIGRGPNECKIAAKKIAMMIYDEAQILKLGAYIPEHQEDEYGWQSALISLETPSEEFAQSWKEPSNGLVRVLYVKHGNAKIGLFQLVLFVIHHWNIHSKIQI